MSTSIAYVRLYADATGASHIERDLHIQLKPTNFVPLHRPSMYLHFSLRPHVPSLASP